MEGSAKNNGDDLIMPKYRRVQAPNILLGGIWVMAVVGIWVN